MGTEYAGPTRGSINHRNPAVQVPRILKAPASCVSTRDSVTVIAALKVSPDPSKYYFIWVSLKTPVTPNF